MEHRTTGLKLRLLEAQGSLKQLSEEIRRKEAELERERADRMRAEKALQESEDRFRDLTEKSMVGVHLSQDGIFKYVNPRFAEIHGYRPAQIVGKLGPADLIPVEDWPQVEAAFLEHLSGTGPTAPMQHRARKKGGRGTVVVEAYGAATTFEGRPAHLGVVLDISERKKTEEALRKSEAMLTSILAASPVGIAVVGKNRTIEWANPGMSAITGYSVEELKGRSTRIFYENEKTWNQAGARLKRAEQTGKAATEASWRHRDGRAMDVTLNISAIDPHDMAAGTVLIVEDVTERKKAEQAALQRTEELDRFFAVALDLLCIADTDGCFRRLNPAWERTLGYEMHKLEGRRFLDFVHPDDMESTLGAVADLSSRRDVTGFINRYRCKDGVYRWLEWRSASPDGRSIFAAAHDVTDRLVAEQRLAESEERYRSAIENSHDAVTIVMNDRHAYVNGRFLDTFGYASMEEFAALPATILVHPDDRERIEEYSRKRLRGESAPMRYEFRGLRKDGVTIYLEASVSRVRLGGEPASFIFLRDISERKTAERLLSESEARYRALFDNSPVALMEADGSAAEAYVWALRSEGMADPERYLEEHPEAAKECLSRLRFVAVNKAALELYGAVDLEAYQHGLDVFLQRVPLSALRSDFLAIAEGRSMTEREGRYPTGRGDLLYIQSRWTTVPGYSTPYARILVCDVDLTQRKAAEEALRKSEEKYRHIFERAAEGIFQSTPEGRFVTVNQAYARMLGYDSPEDLIDSVTSIGDQLYVNPDDRRKSLELASRTYAGATVRSERKFRRKDGSIIWVSINSGPVFDEDGKIVYYEGVAENITDRKRVEEELHKAKTAAEDLARAKSAFLANMSHEIRTPMNAIVGLTRLALKEKPSPKLRDYLTKVQFSANILTGIINDILDLSKIEAGRLTINGLNFKPLQLLKEVTSLFSEQAKEKGIALLVESDPHIPALLKGDPLRLSQVLINLVGNALKFTETGRIRVSCDVVSHVDDAVRLRFSVRDTGIGITKGQKKSLFQPFIQLDSSIARKRGGTGLGLAISKELVSLMGGEIDVESTPGAGSTFVFTIPLRVAARLPKGKDQGVPVPRPARQRDLGTEVSGGRVLVVEDNGINMQVLSEILKGLGLKVETAISGQEALKVLGESRTPFDAVLLDVQMPEMDGYEVARAIRTDPAMASLPVIAVTAHVGEEERRLCIEAGMNDRVTKPVDPEELGNTLARWIAGDNFPSPHVTRTVQPDNPAFAGSPVRLPGVDMRAALKRLSGNSDLLLRLFRNFLKDHGDTAESIREALSRGDTDLARKATHMLKGAAGNLSITDVFESAKSLEEAIKRADSGAAAIHMERLGRAFEQLSEAAGDSLEAEKQEPPKAPSSGSTPTTVPALASLLTELHSLLLRRSLRARKTFDALKGLIDDDKVRKSVEACGEAIARLDFKAADDRLKSMAPVFGVFLPPEENE